MENDDEQEVRGEGRGTKLSSKLDKLSDKVSGLTVVDLKGYFTNLKSMKITRAEVSDTNKAGLLLKSFAAAKREFNVGRPRVARQLIKKGLEVCRKSEDVWLEACRLASLSDAKAVIACGITAAKLEEGSEIDQDKWMEAAEAAERAGSVAICQANTIDVGVEEEDWKRTWEAKARERGGTEKVWMKSAIVERELGNTDEERRLLDEGLKLLSSFFELWLMLEQLEEQLGNLEQAKKAYKSGLKHCPDCISLWLSLFHLEEKVSGLCKARVVLKEAREKNPQNEELWLAEVRADYRYGYYIRRMPN